MKGKCCTQCGKFKSLLEFNVSKKAKDGRRSECRECQKKYDRGWYKRNKEYKKEAVKAYIKTWRQEHPEDAKVYYQTRRAMKKALPHDLSREQWLEILVKYRGGCAITGKATDVNMEHFIALNTGHGGTIIGNIYPMNGSLNSSKNSQNPFEWMKQLNNEQKKNYRKVIRHLAKLNGMTYKEFKDYTYWCYNNPRTVEQVEKDNEKGLTSIEIFHLTS